jgi:hypothetical protein
MKMMKDLGLNLPVKDPNRNTRKISVVNAENSDKTETQEIIDVSRQELDSPMLDEVAKRRGNNMKPSF